jgi:ABC-2 type transport system permease protein
MPTGASVPAMAPAASAASSTPAAGEAEAMLDTAHDPGGSLSPLEAGGGAVQNFSLARTNWVGYRTIVIREYGRIMRIWGQTLAPGAVSAFLYLLIFGSVVGRAIGHLSGVSYVAYIGPALIMLQVINNSYANVVSSFFGAKFGKHVEELLVSPLPDWLIVAGYITGGLLRGTLMSLVVSGITLLFVRLPLHHPAVVVLAVLLSSLVFSLAGFINAMYARNFEQMNIIPTFVLTPLTYLGGTFYSIHMLPAWAQRLSLADPILYMINAFRYGFLGISDVNVTVSLGMMGALVVALYVTAVLLLHRGVGVRD